MLDEMELNYCEELFTRDEAAALFETYVKEHPQHHIKHTDGYPYYFGGTIGAWFADVHNRAFAGVLVLGADKEIALEWTHTVNGELLAR